MATLRLTCVNVLKAKDRGGMSVSVRPNAWMTSLRPRLQE